jgi:hypothetical protein
LNSSIVISDERLKYLTLKIHLFHFLLILFTSCHTTIMVRSYASASSDILNSAQIQAFIEQQIRRRTEELEKKVRELKERNEYLLNLHNEKNDWLLAHFWSDIGSECRSRSLRAILQRFRPAQSA